MGDYSYLTFIIPLLFFILFIIARSRLEQLIKITIKIGNLVNFFKGLPIEYQVSLVNVEMVTLFVIIAILILCNHLFSNLKEIAIIVMLPIFVAMILNIIIAEKFIRKKEGK